VDSHDGQKILYFFSGSAVKKKRQLLAGIDDVPSVLLVRFLAEPSIGIPIS
jgi:hypothetical protein